MIENYLVSSALFKYMPVERISFFDDWLTRFTQPKALNDPFEMCPHVLGYGTHDQGHNFVLCLCRPYEEFPQLALA